MKISYFNVINELEKMKTKELKIAWDENMDVYIARERAREQALDETIDYLKSLAAQDIIIMN